MTFAELGYGIWYALASLKRWPCLISGHKTRSVFERYNIVDERDLHEAANKLYKHLHAKNAKEK
jgi:hypothetical protein